jgi:hypothetical protein
MKRHPAANCALFMGEEPLEPAPRPKRKRASPKVTETAIVNAIRARLILSGIVCQANPNEARSAALGAARHIRGTILGFPDLTCIGPAGRVAFLEVKRPGAKPSGAKAKAHWGRQEATRAMLARMGHLTALVRCQDEAAAVLRAAGWPVQ